MAKLLATLLLYKCFHNHPSSEGLQGIPVLPYDSAILNGFGAANVGTIIANPCSEISINTVATTYIGTDFIELAGKRFDTKQLAYLLVKLLEEHPECQV